MKYILFITTIFSFLMLAPEHAMGQEEFLENYECSCEINKATFVTTANPHTVIPAKKIVPRDSDWNQKNPILSTTVRAKKGCIFIHFSAEVTPTDNAAYFFITINDKPVQGQFVTSSNNGSILVIEERDERDVIDFIPVILQAEGIISESVRDRIRNNINQKHIPRMISHSFATQAEKKDEYTIKVYFAGCCSSSEDISIFPFVRAPTLTVQYRK